VSKAFDAWLAKELAGINSALTAKGLQPISPLTRPDWEKKAQAANLDNSGLYSGFQLH
jgi:hypothetical protein